MALKTILIIDKERKMAYLNALKSEPVLCSSHGSYVWYVNHEGKDALFCKKGEHVIVVDNKEFEIVEI